MDPVNTSQTNFHARFFILRREAFEAIFVFFFFTVGRIGEAWNELEMKGGCGD